MKTEDCVRGCAEGHEHYGPCSTGEAAEQALKPCPFCGAAAKVKRDAGSYGYTAPTVWIQCSVQEWVRTPAQQETVWIQGKGHIAVAEGALQKCVDVWNARATSN